MTQTLQGGAEKGRKTKKIGKALQIESMKDDRLDLVPQYHGCSTIPTRKADRT
jgi:glycine betaine/choline ABC-type transport system substrate-binding protein